MRPGSCLMVGSAGADVPTVTAERVSVRYVDSDGQPLDARRWIRSNALLAGAGSAFLLLASFNGRGAASFGLGVCLSAGVGLGAAALSRAWSLVFDRRHLDQTRDFWVNHDRRGRRRCLRAAAVVAVVAVAAVVVALRTGWTLVAELAIGPLFGALFLLAMITDLARARAARAQPPKGRASGSGWR
jgi:drug/metabolite transporter (DMT)-like permease